MLGYEKNNDDNIKFYNPISAIDGHLTGKKIKEIVKDFKDTAVLMCGPVPMMEAVKADLIKEGVPEENIVFEDFSFV